MFGKKMLFPQDIGQAVYTENVTASYAILNEELAYLLSSLIKNFDESQNASEKSATSSDSNSDSKETPWPPLDSDLRIEVVNLLGECEEILNKISYTAKAKEEKISSLSENISAEDITAEKSGENRPQIRFDIDVAYLYPKIANFSLLFSSERCIGNDYFINPNNNNPDSVYTILQKLSQIEKTIQGNLGFLNRNSHPSISEIRRIRKEIEDKLNKARIDFIQASAAEQVKEMIDNYAKDLVGDANSNNTVNDLNNAISAINTWTEESYELEKFWINEIPELSPFNEKNVAALSGYEKKKIDVLKQIQFELDNAYPEIAAILSELRRFTPEESNEAKTALRSRVNQIQQSLNAELLLIEKNALIANIPVTELNQIKSRITDNFSLLWQHIKNPPLPIDSSDNLKGYLAFSCDARKLGLPASRNNWRLLSREKAALVKRLENKSTNQKDKDNISFLATLKTHMLDEAVRKEKFISNNKKLFDNISKILLLVGTILLVISWFVPVTAPISLTLTIFAWLLFTPWIYDTFLHSLFKDLYDFFVNGRGVTYNLLTRMFISIVAIASMVVVFSLPAASQLVTSIATYLNSQDWAMKAYAVLHNIYKSYTVATTFIQPILELLAPVLIVSAVLIINRPLIFKAITNIQEFFARIISPPKNNVGTKPLKTHEYSFSNAITELRTKFDANSLTSDENLAQKYITEIQGILAKRENTQIKNQDILNSFIETPHFKNAYVILSSSKDTGNQDLAIGMKRLVYRCLQNKSQKTSFLEYLHHTSPDTQQQPAATKGIADSTRQKEEGNTGKTDVSSYHWNGKDKKHEKIFKELEKDEKKIAQYQSIIARRKNSM